MNKCKVCTKQLVEHQQLFCSSSCAAKHNNRTRTSKKTNTTCKQCQVSLRGKNGNTFCSHDCRALFNAVKRFQEGKAGPKAVRTYLLKTKDNVCAVCKRSEWQSQPIPLEVDHVDGNYKNNVEANLRLLCPNCHALTPTYKGRNKGNGRHQRLSRYHEGKSW